MNDTDKAVLQTAENEIADDVKLVVEAVKLIRAKDKAGLVALAPKIFTEVKEDIAAIKPAIPVIKAGYKTTEFWLISVLFAANAYVFQTTGKVLPFDINATFASLLAVYTPVRTAFKSKQ